jgi:hypothetical protein
VRQELEENPLLEEMPEEKQEVDSEVPTTVAAEGTDLAPRNLSESRLRPPRSTPIPASSAISTRSAPACRPW